MTTWRVLWLFSIFLLHFTIKRRISCLGRRMEVGVCSTFPFAQNLNMQLGHFYRGHKVHKDQASKAHTHLFQVTWPSTINLKISSQLSNLGHHHVLTFIENSAISWGYAGMCVEHKTDLPSKRDQMKQNLFFSWLQSRLFIECLWYD